MNGLENISKEEVLYDLDRHFEHAKQVYEGYLDDKRLTKEGAFRRMQVFKYAIDNIKINRSI